MISPTRARGQRFKEPWALTYTLVASSNDGDDAGLKHGLDGAVERRGEAAAQGHVHDGLAADALLLDVLNDPLHAVNDTTVAAVAIGVEDLDSDNLGVLGDSKGGARDGAGDVATVAVLIGVLDRSAHKKDIRVGPLVTYNVVDKVGAPGGTVAKLRVGGQDARVEDVGGNTLAG